MAFPFVPLTRLLRREEANTHFLLQHDRVVKVFAFSVGEGSRPPCLIMERMDGTLHDSLERGSVPLETRLEYIIDICEVKRVSSSRESHRTYRNIRLPPYKKLFRTDMLLFLTFSG